ncbi:MAG: LytTR family DNA-binding domain-containing protein [Spirosomataceae bacterium]
MKTILTFPVNLIRAIFSAIGGFFNLINSQIAAFIKSLGNPTTSSVVSIKGLIISFVVGIVVAVVAVALQPFGLANFDNPDKTLFLAGFGAAAVIGMLICQFALPSVLGSFYNEYRWTVGKQIIHILICVFVVSALSIIYSHQFKIAQFDFAIDLAKVLAISVIPAVILAFINEKSARNGFILKAESINSSLKNQTITKATQLIPNMTFVGENGAKLSILPNQLIYAEISANSTEFHYQSFMSIEKMSMPIGKAVVEKELASHPQFVRCHHNFIVNSHAIQNVTGSGRGYDLTIARVNREIAVARRFNTHIEKI